jgi:carbamoyl-phosphate synthase large subunit
MTKPRRLSIAVSGLNNTDNPGPGIPFIRAIKASQHFELRIIGLVYENLEPGIYMPDMTDRIFQMPYPSEGKVAFLSRIKEIHAHEPIDVLIPNFDAELHTVLISKQELSELGIHTFLPTLTQLNERHKSNLSSFGEKYHIKVPKSMDISGTHDIEKISEDFSYPVMVKGKFYDAYLAYNKDQVISHFNKISAQWGVPVILQEFIRGTEVNVIALGNGKGDTTGAVPMRKQYITDKGKAWGGITIDDPQLLKLTHQLIEATKWQGGMELEIIKTSNSDYYLIEINPRLPAWLYLAVGAGQNLPEATLRMALGEDVAPYTSYEIGKMFVRYSYDLLVNLSEFQEISLKGEK